MDCFWYVPIYFFYLNCFAKKDDTMLHNATGRALISNASNFKELIFVMLKEYCEAMTHMVCILDKIIKL